VSAARTEGLEPPRGTPRAAGSPAASRTLLTRLNAVEAQEEHRRGRPALLPLARACPRRCGTVPDSGVGQQVWSVTVQLLFEGLARADVSRGQARFGDGPDRPAERPAIVSTAAMWPLASQRRHSSGRAIGRPATTSATRARRL